MDISKLKLIEYTYDIKFPERYKYYLLNKEIRIKDEINWEDLSKENIEYNKQMLNKLRTDWNYKKMIYSKCWERTLSRHLIAEGELIEYVKRRIARGIKLIPIDTLGHVIPEKFVGKECPVFYVKDGVINLKNSTLGHFFQESFLEIPEKRDFKFYEISYVDPWLELCFRKDDPNL